MKRCSTPLAIRKMHIKITVRYQLIPTLGCCYLKRKKKNKENNCWREWNLHILLVGILNGSLASKNSMRAPQKVKHDVITLVPGLGRSPGEGKGYPLQYSGLENSMDCIVHGAAKSWTWLSDIHLSYDPGISSWVYTKKMKNIPFTQNLYMNVHNNIVHNSQRVKITQTSIKWEKDNQNVVHPYNRKLFNNKKNEVLIHATT